MQKKQNFALSQQDSNESAKNSLVKTNTGIFLVIEGTKKDAIFLVSCENKKRKVPKKELFKNISSGKWNTPSEKEAKEWYKLYQSNIAKLTNKLLKRIIVAELLIEIDESLEDNNVGDKHFRNLLKKSNKKASLIADKRFDDVYKADPDLTQNILISIEQHAENLSQLKINDYPFFIEYCKKYFENPEKYRDLKVEFTKQK